MTDIDTVRWQQIDDLLAAALERPASERRAFVETACRDAALSKTVLSLLELESRTPAFLEGDAVGHALPFLADLEGPEVLPVSGDRIGAYRLVREIGRGGMSVVFLAERDDGRFHKRVAVKVIQPQLMPTHFRARFQSERDILARLEHPSIARLLDGGETERGEPYLVMEYVEGEPVDAYCDRRALSVEDRIALFLNVGEAVAYAHQNLVVHRDIKPRNVFVSDSGEVKLLDFGIAKVLSEGAEVSMQTVTGDRAMTPAYASPEQVRGEPIRTVSDVYSLGVLLYQLLTGQPPHRPGALPHEIAAAILDQEPTRPSAVVTPEAGRRRRLRGDLDAIVMKALRKAPDRRYPSVEAFLDDLRRHLAGAPVAARGDDRSYRFGKFVRRNWPVLAVTAGLVVAGSGAAAFHARRIQRERDVARREAATAEAVTRFVGSLFSASNAWESSQTRADTLTARALLEQGTKRIRTELAAQPEVRAELLGVLGKIYSSLGEWDQAESLLTEALSLRRALHEDHGTGMADDLEQLALVSYRKGDYRRAESGDREAYEIRRRLFGPESAEAAASLGRMAMDLRKEGELAESERFFREALRIERLLHGDEHKDVAAAMKGLAMIRRERGDLQEAEAFARQALGISRRQLGETDPLTTEHRSDLATILRTKGDLDEAERLFRRALEDTRHWFGDEHPNVAMRFQGLALTLQEKGAFDEAERLYREALRLNRKFAPRDHPQIAMNLHNLGTVLYDQDDLRHAEPLLEEALEMRRRVLGPAHPDVAVTTSNIAWVALEKGDPARAAALFQEALSSLRKRAPDHSKLADVELGFGRTLVTLGRPAEAEPHLREARRLGEKTRPPTHPTVVLAGAALGHCLLLLGRPPEAAPLIVFAHDRVQSMKPRDRRFVEAAFRQWTARRDH